MGKMKENPRYNVLSFRLGDEEFNRIKAMYQRDGVLGQSFTDFARELFLKGLPD